MKLRISLTLIIAALFAAATGIWASVEAPMRGAATAAQLDDTLQSWVVANTVRSNFVEVTTAAICLAMLVLIWWPRAEKTTNDK